MSIYENETMGTSFQASKHNKSASGIIMHPANSAGIGFAEP